MLYANYKLRKCFQGNMTKEYVNIKFPNLETYTF